MQCELHACGITAKRAQAADAVQRFFKATAKLEAIAADGRLATGSG
jgi:hypothetical protein